jgi:uncharacterized cupin superfamily protein
MRAPVSESVAVSRREPHDDARGARLARGTAARNLGASIDILAPGKRGCPDHLHHAQEEVFIVLEGQGTLRVAGDLRVPRLGQVPRRGQPGPARCVRRTLGGARR